MPHLSIPNSGRLPSTIRVHHANNLVQKLLNRLSRASLISLALEWLDDRNLLLCAPRIHHGEDENDFYPPAQSLGDLRQLYREMQARKGSKREAVDRILLGDWRHGLSLYQLATADMRYFHEHPTAQKWLAYRISPLAATTADGDDDERDTVDIASMDVPRVHPSTFLENLQSHVLPDIQAHYHLDRIPGLGLLLIRVFLVDSPYSTDLAPDLSSAGRGGAPVDASRTIYIALPDGSPFMYLSKPQSTGAQGSQDSKAFRSLVSDGIPKALSRPRQRYSLEFTDAQTKNLSALLFSRGAGRTNAAGGGWAAYADMKRKESPLDNLLPTTPPPLEDVPQVTSQGLASRKRSRFADAGDQEEFSSRAKRIAKARFGDAAKLDDGKGVERVDIVIKDPFEAATQNNETLGTSDSSSPSIQLTFRGPHVFAGVRQLVENGVIDGAKMPAWLAGDDGRTMGTVRRGRLQSLNDITI